MLNRTEKGVLNAIREKDGQLESPEEVARVAEGVGDIELVESALHSLIAEGYVQDNGHQNPDGGYTMRGPFWTVDHNVDPLVQGGVL